MGFVAKVEIDGNIVHAELRLPTYFCAPNFAYLMAQDARDALSSLPGVAETRVTLVDHFSSDQINAGVARRQPFDHSFSEHATGDLAELRRIFEGKAFIARQEKLCRVLLAEGISPEELSRMRLRDVPARPEADAYLERRRDLGFDLSGDAPLVLDAAGTPVQRDRIVDHLRRARMVRLSMEGNAGLCRGLLATRYGASDPEEVSTG